MPSLLLPAYRVTRRDLRLGSGLVLFGYVTAHFVNHTLGLVSVNAAEAGLRIAVAFWHSLPGTVLLYSAAGAAFQKIRKSNLITAGVAKTGFTNLVVANNATSPDSKLDVTAGELVLRTANFYRGDSRAFE